jgi:hypothetical protein
MCVYVEFLFLGMEVEKENKKKPRAAAIFF